MSAHPLPKKETSVQPASASPPAKAPFVDDLLRLLYGAMLSLLTPDLVERFWARQKKRVLVAKSSVADVLNAVWTCSSPTSIHGLWAILNDVEPFLVSNGCPVDAEKFSNVMYSNIYPGWIGPAEQFLAYINTQIPGVINAKDPRQFLLEFLMPAISHAYAMGAVTTIAAHYLRKGWHETSIVSLEPEGVRLSPFDAELWLKPFHKTMPCRFRLRPFEKAAVAASRIPPNNFADTADMRIIHGEFQINGEKFGLVVPFSAFCARLGFEIADYGIPDTKVVAMTRDHYCPERNRIVLRAGSAYGAPAYVFKLRYKAMDVRSDNSRSHPLRGLIEEITDAKKDPWLRITSAHRTLMTIAGPNVSIEYDKTRETISVNDANLTRGVSAKILRKIVREYVRRGRTEFTRKEFLYDSKITLDRKNPSLAVRFARLSALLARRCPRLSIVTASGARIIFKAACPVRYRDKRAPARP